jgi:ferredoxin--NADP+ reductase
MVLASVGYRGLPLPGLPFDSERGVVPNIDGRVLRDGQVVPGEYVAGWIKRGPTGIIGTNKRDARETVQALLSDAPTLPRAPVRDPGVLPAELAERGVRLTSWPA